MVSRRKRTSSNRRPARRAKRASRRRAAVPGFWHTPTGRVAAGIAALALAVGAAGLYDWLTRPPSGEAPLARLILPDAVQAPSGAPGPGVDMPAAASPRPAPLSRDPVARIPENLAWRKNSVAATIPGDRPLIAVVIDDVGLDRPRSRRAMALPPPLTIALMAYADDGRDQAAHARERGHELLVHLPMEPSNGAEDPGPNALLSGLSAAEFTRRLEWNLTQFAGYVGVNNHMGSKLTSDPQALAPVMAALKQRGLLFLDSRTTGDTHGLAVAQRFGVPAVERDVFIDHDTSPIAVRTALLQVEDLARRNGFAIAIGHPKDVTLDALEEWLPDVKARGFAVVPLTAIVRRLVAQG